MPVPDARFSLLGGELGSPGLGADHHGGALEHPDVRVSPRLGQSVRDVLSGQHPDGRYKLEGVLAMTSGWRSGSVGSSPASWTTT
jgi:hypothetical protein